MTATISTADLRKSLASVLAERDALGLRVETDTGAYDALSQHFEEQAAQLIAAEERADRFSAALMALQERVLAAEKDRDEALSEHTDMMWQRRRAVEGADAAEERRDAAEARAEKMMSRALAAEGEVKRLTEALKLALRFVDRAGDEGIGFVEEDGIPEMDAADICGEVAGVLRIEFGGPEYMALIALAPVPETQGESDAQ